jgi:hypothetical protein
VWWSATTKDLVIGVGPAGGPANSTSDAALEVSDLSAQRSGGAAHDAITQVDGASGTLTGTVRGFVSNVRPAGASVVQLSGAIHYDP